MRAQHPARRAVPAAIAAFVLPLVAIVSATGANAQGLFPWEWNLFGDQSSQTQNSGRQVVSFPRSVAAGQIIVSFTDRRLYYVPQRGTAIAYPIATPRVEDRWQGVLHVSRKQVDPPWSPTASMLRDNPSMPRYVEGGDPRNPLGTRALYLGNTLYRIHGTDAPWTIGKPVSAGCIRMYNADVNDLYNRVGVGTKVTITWSTFYGYS